MDAAPGTTRMEKKIIMRDATTRVIPATAIQNIKREILEKFEGCDICRWEEDWDWDDNDESEYWYEGNINDIIEIIDKYTNKGDKR